MSYINNERFEKVIAGYKSHPSIWEDELIENFDLLIKNIFDGFKFQGVEFDDVKQDCFLLIFVKIKNFSPDKGTAFNFFTTVILNNIRLLYSKEKRQKEKIQAYWLKWNRLDSDLFTDPPDSDP
jgi:DNA-directed RNA polymerase specialized sigma24 family protein